MLTSSSLTCPPPHIPPPHSYNKLSRGLIFSSFGHFILILMVIWDFQELEYAWLIQVLVLLSHSEALAVLTGMDRLGRGMGVQSSSDAGWTPLPTCFVGAGLGFKWALRYALAHVMPPRFAPLFSV